MKKKFRNRQLVKLILGMFLIAFGSALEVKYDKFYFGLLIVLGGGLIGSIIDSYENLIKKYESTR